MWKGPVIGDQDGELHSVESDTLVSGMQDTADALEEADGRLQVKLMVYSAVVKGILSAIEMEEGREPVASGQKKLSVLKAKTEDITDGLLISMLHEEEEELIKLVDDSDRKRRQPALEKVMEELTNNDANLLPAAKESHRKNRKGALQDAYFLAQAVSLSVQNLKQEALPMNAKFQGNAAVESPDVEVENTAWCDLETRYIIESLHKMLQRVAKDIHLVEGQVTGHQNNGIPFRPLSTRWRPPEEAAKEKLGSSAPGLDFYQDSTTLDDSVVGEDMQTLIRADTAISHLKRKLVQGKPKNHFEQSGGESPSSELKDEVARHYNDGHLHEFLEQVVEVPGRFGDDAVVGSIPMAEQGGIGEPRFGREGIMSEKEMMLNLQEHAWKIQVENSIILSVLDGLSRTYNQSHTKRNEQVKRKHDKASCPRSTVSEFDCQPDVSAGRKLQEEGGQEQSPDSNELSSRARPECQVGSPQEQCAAGSSEAVNLVKNLKACLLARIGTEKERAGRLEEALAEQQWRTEVELDVITTLLWEGRADNGSTWNINEPLDMREIETHQRHGGQPLDERAGVPCGAPDSTKHTPDELFENSRLAYGAGESRRTDEGLSNGRELPHSDPGAINRLVRQNAELRRENEKLVEKQTEEIYTLKREFYKELDKVQRQLGQLDPESTGQRKGAEASLAQRALSNLKMFWTKKMQDELAQDLKFGGGRASEAAGLLRVGSAKFEKNPVGVQQSGDFSSCVSSALDGGEHLRPECPEIKNSPAASESEESADNIVQTSEMIEPITLDEKTVSNVVADQICLSGETENSQVAGPESGACASSGHATSNLGSEESIGENPSVDAGEKIQTQGSVSKELGDDPNHILSNFNLRDRETQTHGLQCQDVCTPTFSSVGHPSSAQDFQKAETEVDMLGDEVDSLMDLLEKVYYVLNHYSPIIQCYPGIADLLTLVKQEVLQRVQDS